MTESEEYFHETCSAISRAEKGKLFGKPCYTVNGKAFTCFFQDCMVVKLIANEHSEALRLSGAQLFDPSGKGRPMKEWVQLPYDQKATWPRFAEAAFSYVNS